MFVWWPTVTSGNSAQGVSRAASLWFARRFQASSIRVTAWSYHIRSFGIVLEHALRDSAADCDDCAVVTLLPGSAEARPNRFAAEALEALAGFAVVVELAQERPFPELLQVACFARIRDIPTILALVA